MGTDEFLKIRNVKQFVTTQRRHAQDLVRRGHIFERPIPQFLRPHTRQMQRWPGKDDVAFDEALPGSRARAIAPEDRARIGGFDTFQIVAKPPFEYAGHTMTVGPTDFLYPMAGDIAREKVTRPQREWMETTAKGIMNLVTSGAYFDGSDARTEGQAFEADDFEGTTVTVDTITESSDEASATVAHSSHSVTWPDRVGGTFSAGHDHVPADTGAAWTESDGRNARDHLTEHPGINGVVAYVGDNVVIDLETTIESVRSSTESGVDFERGGVSTGGDFGVPKLIGRHDNVTYFHVPDLPADLGLYMGQNSSPVGYWAGQTLQDGQTRDPRPWGETTDPERQIEKTGFRGPGVAHIVNPTAIFLDRYA